MMVSSMHCTPRAGEGRFGPLRARAEELTCSAKHMHEPQHSRTAVSCQLRGAAEVDSSENYQKRNVITSFTCSTVSVTHPDGRDDLADQLHGADDEVHEGHWD